MTSLPLAELIEPNWHVAVVHFPIGLLCTGFVAEVIGAVFGARSLRDAARWMILLGAMFGVPVALSGLYALHDLVSGDRYGTWESLLERSPLTERQWQDLLFHARLQIGATLIGLTVSAVFLAMSDGARKVLYLPLLSLLGAAVGLTMAGAHVAGQSVYRDGTGTMTAVKAVKAADAPPAKTGPTSMPTDDPDAIAAYFAPPLQLHAVLAGLTFSVGVMAFASAYRTASVMRAVVVPTKPPGVPREGAVKPAMPARLPVARLMLLTTLLGLSAASAGIWHLSRETQTHRPAELWENVLTFPPAEWRDPAHADELRRPAHVALGLTVLLIPLLLAPWARWRAKGRVVLSVAALVWIPAATAQTYLGALLLFDTPVGPLTRLNHRPVEPPTPDEAMPETTEPTTSTKG